MRCGTTHLVIPVACASGCRTDRLVCFLRKGPRHRCFVSTVLGLFLALQLSQNSSVTSQAMALS